MQDPIIINGRLRPVKQHKPGELVKAVQQHPPGYLLKTVIHLKPEEAYDAVQDCGNRQVEGQEGGPVLPVNAQAFPEVRTTVGSVDRFSFTGMGIKGLQSVDKSLLEQRGIPFGSNGEFEVIGNELCYFDPQTGRWNPLCNFYVIGVTKVIVNGVRGNIDSVLEFRVFFEGEETLVKVKKEQWDRFYAEVRKKCPGTSISLEGSKHSYWIEKYISQCIRNAPIESEYLVPGWHELDGKLKFLHDGRLLPGIRCKTGKFIEVDRQLSYVAAFREAWQILSLTKDLAKTLIPFLFAHLGLLTSIFSRAGYHPRFLLFVVGETGALKTELSKTLFALYSGDSRRVPASFKDTITALERKMFQRGDGVLTIDDYHPPVSSAEKNSMAEKLEAVIRYQGDGIAKGRANARLELQPDLAAHCLVACTGEFASGSESSMLRLLLVELKKGEIDGDKLEPFQYNPRLLATHWQGFLEYVEAHVDQLTGFIQNNFAAKRREWSSQFVEKRLVDAATHLDLVCAIVLSYGKELGAFTQEEAAQLYAKWKPVLFRVTAQSLALTKQAKPIVMMLEAIEYLVDNKTKLASSRAQFAANQEDWLGFFEDSFVFFDHKKLCPKVAQYWRDHGKACNLNYTDIFAELAELGITETTKDGKGRRAYYKKVAIDPEKPDKRVRMLVVRLEAMVAFMEAESQR